MRVLFFSTEFPPRLGGVATLSLEQAVGLARLGNDVRVETIHFGDLPEVCRTTTHLNVNARQIKHVPIARLLPLSAVVWKSSSEFSPDLYYASTHRGFGLPMMLRARQTGKPYSIYIHGSEILTEVATRTRKVLLSQMLSHASVLVCNSNSTRQMVLTQFPDLRPSIEVVYPGIGTDQKIVEHCSITQKSTQFRREWLTRSGLPSDCIILLSSCRLSHQKGIAETLNALGTIHRRKPELPWLYVICGTGPNEAEFKSLANELGLAHKVMFLGKVPDADIWEVRRSCDIYIQPSQPKSSWVEGFGISFVEAQFCGLPCIGTKFGGIPEAVKDGETGILVEPGNQQALEEAILTLMTNEDLRKRMSEAARKHAAGFSWESHCRQLHEIFSQCIAPRGGNSLR
jgi:phosphatidylinositol alpha-1,6-mannosyltransferase